MTFVELKPPEHQKACERVSAAIRGFGRGGFIAKLELAFSRAIALRLKKRCSILVGEGEDKGLLILKFSDEGPFGVFHMKSEKAFIRLEPPACIPKGFLLGALPCETEWIEDSVKLKLPLEGWKDIIPKELK